MSLSVVLRWRHCRQQPKTSQNLQMYSAVAVHLLHASPSNSIQSLLYLAYGVTKVYA